MAYYKDQTNVKQYDGDMFKPTHNPGDRAPYAGIYRCTGCGKETSHNAGVSLPPQNHHEHTTAQGAVKWQLLVWAITS